MNGLYTRRGVLVRGERIPPREVRLYGGMVVFDCPCGGRTISLREAAREVGFNLHGCLTVEGVIEPAAGCRFRIEHGRAVMEQDATCPGATLPA